MNPKFRNAVETVFNSWSALRLAVENGMGGRNGQKTAIEMMEYIYQYCVQNIDVTETELQEILEEIMDQEFNTVCEDGSIIETCARIILYFKLCREEKYNDLEAHLAKLPKTNYWLVPDVKIVYTHVKGEDTSSSSEESSNEESMEVDTMPSIENHNSMNIEYENGWTVVSTRRRK